MEGLLAIGTLATWNNCGSGHCAGSNLAIFLLLSFALFPIGALIGGQIPK